MTRPSNGASRWSATPALPRRPFLGRRLDGDSVRGVQGLLLALGPASLVLGLSVDALRESCFPWIQVAQSWCASAAAVLFLLGGLRIPMARRFGRWTGVLGLVALGLATIPALADHPALVLLALVSLISVGNMLFGLETDLPPPPAATRDIEGLRQGLRAACLPALVCWFLVDAQQVSRRPEVTLAALATAGLAMLVGIRWAIHAWRGWSRSQRLWLLAPLGTIVLSLLSLPHRTSALGWLALGNAIFFVLARPPRPSTVTLWQAVIQHPARLVVVTFALLCFVGGVLLTFPASGTMPGGATAIDGLFTATSAVCVTGLTVLDTPHDFTLFGQAVIAALIQVGGLGIMTFSTAGSMLLRRRMGLREEEALEELVVGGGDSNIYRAIRRLLTVSFTIEGIGALILFADFHTREGAVRAAWRAVFTAISAYCNAGFALQSDNLVPYQTDPVVLQTVALLTVSGGLGPLAVVSIPRVVRGKAASLNTRLVLAATAILLVLPTILIAAFEWDYAFQGLSWWDKLDNAWFQAVTPRTAGFNSVRMSDLQPTTRTLMMVLMFIGGSPGSTAGGIKTTTFAILVLAVTAALSRHQTLVVFGRRISHALVVRAAAVATVGGMSVVVGLLAIQLTQRIPMDLALFEVISALGTVGLSLGATPMLDTVGKAIIILCMFVGRVGPLTLFLLLSRGSQPGTWTYPEEDVVVG